MAGSIHPHVTPMMERDAAMVEGHGAKEEEGVAVVAFGHGAEEDKGQAVMVDSLGVVDAEVQEVEGRVEEVVDVVVDVPCKRRRLENRQDRVDFIRNTKYSSTCKGCIYPPVCRRCGLRGESSNFLCLECRLPVPKDLRLCEVCGKPLLCDSYWCKDMATVLFVL